MQLQQTNGLKKDRPMGYNRTDQWDMTGQDRPMGYNRTDQWVMTGQDRPMDYDRTGQTNGL